MTTDVAASRQPSGYDDVLGRPAPLTAITGRHDARIVIVGGGLAGLNTALSLAEAGHVDVVLLESRTLGCGASGRNGGFVFAGYSLGEEALLRKVGAVLARRLYQRTVDAVDRVRQRIARYAIACDCVDEGVIWANWFRDTSILRRRQQLLADCFDTRWHWLSKAQLRDLLVTDRYHDALYEPDAMHINPLAYVRGLAAAAMQQGVTIHENSPVLSIERKASGWQVCSPDASIQCAHLVLAGGAHLGGVAADIEQAVMPIATYAMMSEPLEDRVTGKIRTRAAIYDTRFAFDYYRVMPDTRLLWGGRISIRDRAASDVQRLLQRDVARVFPDLSPIPIARAWSGLMSYSRHQMPEIGTRGDGLYWAQGFGGHGIAPTTVAGHVLAEAIAGNTEALADFAPFGLCKTFGCAGLLAAQANYSWLQARDRWHSFTDQRQEKSS